MPQLYKVSLIQPLQSEGKYQHKELWLVCSGLEVVEKIIKEAYPDWIAYAYERQMEDVVVQGGFSGDI